MTGGRDYGRVVWVMARYYVREWLSGLARGRCHQLRRGVLGGGWGWTGDAPTLALPRRGRGFFCWDSGVVAAGAGARLCAPTGWGLRGCGRRVGDRGYGRGWWVVGRAGWRVVGRAGWRVVGRAGWRVVGRAGWRVGGRAGWRVVGRAGWRVVGAGGRGWGLSCWGGDS